MDQNTHSFFTPSRLFQEISLVRERSPLVHNITNFVVMQTTANILLASGASPIMAHAKEELREIVSLANALVINIGTLDNYWWESIETAQKLALSRKIPIVFDPVGSGASRYRTAISQKILENGVSILRGNASEILSLVDRNALTKGVDSTYESETALEAAALIAQRYHCCVVVSGKIDIVSHTDTTIFLDHGNPLLKLVTGMGCSATALIGAFAAVNPNFLHASAAAMLSFGIAAEKAAKLSQGPGTFHPALLDSLYELKEADFSSLRIEINKNEN